MFSQRTQLLATQRVAAQCQQTCIARPMLLVLVVTCWTLDPDPSNLESKRVSLAAQFIKRHKAAEKVRMRWHES